MKILAIAAALVMVGIAETAEACPACNARVGQPMVMASPAPARPRHHHHLFRHHARPAYVPWAMPTMASGCSSCGSGCGVSPYIARPCGCGSSMPVYASSGCGSTGCGSVGCGTTGCGSVGYGMTGHSTASYGSRTGGIRRCVPVSSGPGGQTVMRCYRLIPVPKGTPGALTYQQVMNMTQGANMGGYGTSGYGVGGMGGYGGAYNSGAYGTGSYGTTY